VMGIIASGLADDGYDVDLVLAQKSGPYLDEIGEKVRVVDLGAKRLLWSVPKLRSYLKREQPMVLMSTIGFMNVGAVVAAKLSGCGCRLILREANTSASMSVFARGPGSLFHRAADLFRPFFYRRADGLVAVARQLEDDLVENVGQERAKIRTIYNPTLTPDFWEKSQASPDDASLIPEEGELILAVGRLWEQKDYPTLLEAFRRLRKSRPTANLLILGEGPDRRKLEKQIEAMGLNGAVKMPGFVSNPFPYMRKADLFVLSSKFEGLPNSLIQALACGCQIVSTDCPSGPREVLDGGTYGCLVPVGEVRRLAEGMEDVLERRPFSVPGAWVEKFESDFAIAQYERFLIMGTPLEKCSDQGASPGAPDLSN